MLDQLCRRTDDWMYRICGVTDYCIILPCELPSPSLFIRFSSSSTFSFSSLLLLFSSVPCCKSWLSSPRARYFLHRFVLYRNSQAETTRQLLLKPPRRFALCTSAKPHEAVYYSEVVLLVTNESQKN